MAKHHGPPYIRTLEVLSDAGINPLLVLSSGIGDDGYDMLVLDSEGRKQLTLGTMELIVERKEWPEGLWEKVRDALTTDAQEGPPPVDSVARRRAVLEKWQKPQ